MVGLSFLGVGALSFIYFLFPIISYSLFLSPAFASGDIEAPIPRYLVATEDNRFTTLIKQGIASLTSDYIDARNWYPQIAVEKEKKTEVKQYSLAIPKLQIENAIVSTVDYDLSKNLVHYYGPASPVEKGTSVIFGHSTLPQWFDPTNYKAIFATLHTIEIGDDLVVTVDGKAYTFKVFSVTVTTPEDVNIFSQSYDNSYITLVTCTPPGTTWKRLIVRASLQ